MKDISEYKCVINNYGGSEIKKTYIIENKKYMVKFSDLIFVDGKKVFVNNQYSEYIGSKVFELFNIPVQKVYLVKCFIDGKEKIAVMCEDFLDKDEILVEFKTLSYSLSSERKYTSEINDIFEMINSVTSYKNKDDFENEFWDIFVVDTLIGNVDRHLGNWGIIAKDNVSKLSPVYDCGSALHPLLSEEDVVNIIKNKELKNVSINLKTAYKMHGKTLNYIDVYNIMPEGLNSALKRMYKLIDLDKIKNIIDSIDTLSDTMKYFYYESIRIRKEEIIDRYYTE